MRDEFMKYLHYFIGLVLSMSIVICHADVKVAAYLLYLSHVDDELDCVTVEAVEKYLKTKRPQVGLCKDACVNLAKFRELLLNEGFDAIVAEKKDAIAKRNRQLLVKVA
jgi:hypothetical protein